MIAEAAWLLRHTSGGVSELLGMISNGLLVCHELAGIATGALDLLDPKATHGNIEAKLLAHEKLVDEDAT